MAKNKDALAQSLPPTDLLISKKIQDPDIYISLPAIGGLGVVVRRKVRKRANVQQIADYIALFYCGENS